MIWSRNVAVLALALLAVSFFGAGRLWMINTAGSTPHFVAGAVLSEGDRYNVSGAEVSTVANDRQSFVARMREAVSDRVADMVVPSQSQVANLAEVDMDRQILTDEQDSGNQTETPDLQWCDATVLETQFVASWPSSGVTAEVREGAVVILLTPESTSVGTTTAALAPRSLMQFPASPPHRTEPACLTHGFVGVTPEGRLIHTNDVVLYQNRGAHELIGYAFDGNPIYGVSTETPDSCGGVAGSEYRYHVSPERDFIIGCFVSEPQQTLLVG